MNLPDTILLEIFSYIPLPERWLVSSVCQSWNRVCHDPYLYRYLVFENLEYRTLVLSLQKLLCISPRVKSITIKGCYSKFIQNAVVPVHFSNRANNAATSPMLFSHITALQPPRRRDEYMKHSFELHDQFSDVMSQLLCINETNLITLVIEDCTLDMEMTELFCAIACHGHALETFTYKNNHDKGIDSSGLLQAIVTACPNMRHFRGLHSCMDDAVLLTIARHWTSLQSLTLCSLKSRNIFDHTEIISDGRHLTGSSPTGRIFGHALWQLLCRCSGLQTLELFDLACISNRDLVAFDTLRLRTLEQQENEKRPNNNHQRIPVKRFSPYNIPPKSIFSTTTTTTTNTQVKSTTTTHTNLPGSSIQHLIITKYMTTPLSTPGFESLLRLFPKLNCLEYETNFYTFDNLFKGITREMFNAECAAVQEWCDQRKGQLVYIGRWNAGMTAEQRLMAGMASVSEGGRAQYML